MSPAVRAPGPRAPRATHPRRRLAAAIAVSLLLAVGLGACAEKATAPPPNVLVILIDALRWDYLGVNGYPGPISPHIDRLAAEGVNFTRARSQCTWTKPSIASLFTSTLPAEHQIFLVGQGSEEHMVTRVLSDRFTTIAEAFQAAGYATGASIDQVHLPAKAGFAQGFDWYMRRLGTPAPMLIHRLLEWLDGEQDKPFFAYLHVLDVHWPYRSHLRESKLPPAPQPDNLPPCVREASQAPDCIEAVRSWLAEPSGRQALEDLKRRYAREVEFTDAAIGDLVDELRQRGLYENTIIVVTADHGEGFGEHGHLQHGFAPYEEVMRVPLIVRLPARLRPDRRRIDAPVALIDLYPTLMSMAGLRPESGLAGKNLVPVLHGRPPADRVIFNESVAGDAATDGHWKLIRFSDGRYELFDLSTDPGERKPVSGTCQGPCVRLREGLGRVETLAAKRAQRHVDEVEIDPEDVKELKALGYL
jgi:arylsulfatase A-like enzyme